MPDLHEGFFGPHEGPKETCTWCNLPPGKLVTEQELLDAHATRMMERFESVPEADWAMLHFPWTNQ